MAKGNFVSVSYKRFGSDKRKGRQAGRQGVGGTTLGILQRRLIMVVAKCKLIQGIPLLRNHVGRTQTPPFMLLMPSLVHAACPRAAWTPPYLLT